MNTPSDTLTRTMAQAQVLQRRYEELAAPATQNVRNPIPMKTLVLSTLVVLPYPDAPVKVLTVSTVRINGKAYRQSRVDTVRAKEALPGDTWEKNGRTVDEVAAELRQRGFFANKGTVASALNIAQRFGVRKVRLTRPLANPTGTRKTSGYVRYYIAENP